ncbi:Rieske (2Fe-2S) protein [Intrasporangium sp.]|uniref:Rieske (2Fe-2S) protein n=1 Tax=Intrasporangium sp. TaxID=1925024 RepID=UPI0029395659|nr:Rieske 2Fe-2S domain-containing protein [Intrasporangium sp.]MDV3221226.1 Rieske 2Fe-2S domain-containing protein [Intrasporangium sp.]
MTEHDAGRRSVIVGLAGVAGLAACSSPPVPSTQEPTADPSSRTTSASPGSATSAPATSADPPAAGGTPVTEIPVGSGKIYPDRKVVVTQPAAGTLKAFSTTCTHQGCAVTTINDGHIICPCHGSAFDIESGVPTEASQAKRPLQARTVAVSGDTFTVT